MIHPFAPAPPDRYARLFRPTEPPFDQRAMSELGRQMECDASPILHPRGDAALAGYTYFGQFVDHDLTEDDTAFGSAGVLPPDQTPNSAGGRLDLHHIYGEGPGSETHKNLYEPDGASFHLGPTVSREDQRFDLPLNTSGQPVSADERNAENLILRQISVLFMKLHNLALKESPESLDPQQRFRLARTRVVEQYQWLVFHDYLPKILTDEIYRAVIEGDDRRVDWPRNGFAIPVEFAQAAFRFGHSMVRKEYKLNARSGIIPLKKIFSHEQRRVALSPEQALDWRAFYTANGIPAMLIDTSLVSPLFYLPDTQHFGSMTAIPKPDLPRELSVRTLCRGAATGLPTGQEVAKAFEIPVITESSEPPGSAASWKKLTDLGLRERTPLWYYILLEAEAERLGRTLGTVGSRLVAEVIMGSLYSDAESFVRRHGKDWTPAPWAIPRKAPIQVDTIARAALATGLIS